MKSSTRKIVAGLLGVAMVLTMVAGVAATPASAQTTASYTRNLTVGSRGTDVTALQNVLVAGGYLKVAPTGYFGSLTKAALGAWQASVGITPAAGYFGPITRAYFASMGGGTSTVPGCTAGSAYSTTTGQPCTVTTTVPGCMPGALYSSSTGQSCSGGGTSVGLDNTDGSITAATSAVVSSSVTIKKGETKDLIATRLTATAGKVAVTRFDVQFSERPWLTFSKIELVDNSTGSVVATKNLSSASDVTEVTVGSNYLARFDGLNVVVTPGTDVTLKVRGTLLASSDKITGQTVTVTLPTNGMRTLNGKGYTDSIGTGATASVTLASTGSNGLVTARLGSGTNGARSQQTSSTTETTNVTLLTFDLRSENQDSTISGLNIDLKNNLGIDATTIFKNIRISDGSDVRNANVVATTSQFTNLNYKLAKDQWKSFSVIADIAAQNTFTAGVQATTSLVASSTNPVGIDTNYNSVTVNSTTVTGGAVTLTNSAANLTSLSATQNLVGNGDAAPTQSVASFTYTVNNTSSNPIYVSKVAAVAVASSTSGSATTTGAAVVTVTGDTSNDHATDYYVIQANQSRTFKYDILVSNYAANENIVTQITAVKYSDDTSDLDKYSIGYGLDNLKVSGQVF